MLYEIESKGVLICSLFIVPILRLPKSFRWKWCRIRRYGVAWHRIIVFRDLSKRTGLVPHILPVSQFTILKFIARHFVCVIYQMCATLFTCAHETFKSLVIVFAPKFVRFIKCQACYSCDNVLQNQDQIVLILLW